MSNSISTLYIRSTSSCVYHLQHPSFTQSSLSVLSKQDPIGAASSKTSIHSAWGAKQETCIAHQAQGVAWRARVCQVSRYVPPCTAKVALTLELCTVPMNMCTNRNTQSLCKAFRRSLPSSRRSFFALQFDCKKSNRLITRFKANSSPNHVCVIPLTPLSCVSCAMGASLKSTLARWRRQMAKLMRSLSMHSCLPPIRCGWLISEGDY